MSLPPTELRALTTPALWRTFSRAALEVTAIACAMALGARHLYLYPLVALIIASRQHALLVLMHDCAHGLASRSRLWNDALGELLAWPFLMRMRGYRRHHRLHHVAANINTLRDPDFARKQNDSWAFPLSRRKLAGLLVRDVLLLNLPELIQEGKDAKNYELTSRTDRVLLGVQLGAYAVIAAVLTWCGGWATYVFFWLLPSLTVLKAILRIRSIVDHFSIPNAAQVEPTRSVLAPWWERLLIAPCNIGIHHAHHQYASVPYFRLGEVHRRLWRDARYQGRVHVAPSYAHALFRECSR
jgi:fatty acid desaturase